MMESNTRCVVVGRSKGGRGDKACVMETRLRKSQPSDSASFATDAATKSVPREYVFFGHDASEKAAELARRINRGQSPPPTWSDTPPDGDSSSPASNTGSPS